MIATAFMLGMIVGLVPLILHLRRIVRVLDEQNRETAAAIADWHDRTGEPLSPDV
jgi:hypothetical protein